MSALDDELLFMQLMNNEHYAECSAELAQLRATIEAQADAIRAAREQLRATSENWREDCLFRADAILTQALAEAQP